MAPTDVPKKTFYIIGPSSTGKTTLSEALARRLGVYESGLVKEVARQVMKEKEYSRETIGSLDMQKDIMDAHIAQERALDATGCSIRVCDRSALDPVVYAILTAKDSEDAQSRQRALTDTMEFQEALTRFKARGTIVVLLRPVAEWLVDDGVRSTEDQDRCFGIFEQVLQGLGVSYIPIGTEMRYLEERVGFAMGLANL